MDCDESVDDYCDVSQARNLQILEPNPSSSDDNLDQFLIAFEVEKTFPTVNEDEDGSGYGRLLRVEETERFSFWAPCPRFKHQNLTRERISGMLSRVGVVLHKQDFMADKISTLADEIANAPHFRAANLLPILVTISIVACACYHS